MSVYRKLTGDSKTHEARKDRRGRLVARCCGVLLDKASKVSGWASCFHRACLPARLRTS